MNGRHHARRLISVAGLAGRFWACAQELTSIRAAHGRHLIQECARLGDSGVRS